jgi:hypothetical protein
VAFWASGLFLLLGGLVCLAAPLGLATNAADLEPWERVASFGVGLAVSVGALWWLSRSRASRVELDLARARMSVVCLGLSGREVRQLTFSEMEKVEVEVGADSEGGTVWRPRVRLRGGEHLLLSELWSHDLRGTEDVISVVADACRLPYGFPQPAVERGNA